MPEALLQDIISAGEAINQQDFDGDGLEPEETNPDPNQARTGVVQVTPAPLQADPLDP